MRISISPSWISRTHSFVEIWQKKLFGTRCLGEPGLVCKFCHSLDDIKQSFLAWFGRFSSIIQEFRMLQSEGDCFVFCQQLLGSVYLSSCLCGYHNHHIFAQYGIYRLQTTPLPSLSY